jgi:hypothetical protein
MQTFGEEMAVQARRLAVERHGERIAARLDDRDYTDLSLTAGIHRYRQEAAEVAAQDAVERERRKQTDVLDRYVTEADLGTALERGDIDREEHARWYRQKNHQSRSRPKPGNSSKLDAYADEASARRRARGWRIDTW